jgi:hypothetical protein
VNETSAGLWKDVPKKLGLPRTSWSLEGGGRPNWQKVRGQVYPAGSAELPSAAAYSGGEARVWRYNYLRPRLASDPFI